MFTAQFMFIFSVSVYEDKLDLKRRYRILCDVFILIVNPKKEETLIKCLPANSLV